MSFDFAPELENLLSPLPTKIAVAVSGGADSFALLHLTHQWAKEKNISVLALTVDHGLRPESADEARIVADWCTQHNIPHQTLHWLGEKPDTAIQATARKMRRNLLCAACIEQDIHHLLLGHQADDQAETLLMRLQRGSGLKGLRVMHPFTRHKATGIAIVRPLLHTTRAALRTYCVEQKLPFIDDPSNDKTEFERVRMRKVLQQIPGIASGVAKSAGRLHRADETLQKLAQSWVDTHLQMPDTHSFWLPQDFTTELLPELKIRVLEMILQSRNLSQIEKLNDQLHDPGFAGANLAGMWVKPKVFNKEKGFLFQPEPRRRPARRYGFCTILC